MKYKVGITGTGSLIGQAIIKCLQRSAEAKKYEIVGFEYLKDTVGSFWCDKHIMLTDIYLYPHKEKEWLEELVYHLNHESIDILFVGVDFELQLFAKHKFFLEGKTKCKVIVSSEEVINIGNDKYLTYEFLKKNNLFYPQTYLAKEENFEKIDFPLIVKPRSGARSRGVYKVRNKKELQEKIKIINNPIIQEYVGNDNLEYTCGVLCLDSQLKESIVLRRSLKDGNTYISEHNKEVEDIIYDYIKDISCKLKPFGSCNLQLRIDKNGIPKLFEINPRHSGTTYIRSLFGYNEIVYIINYIMNGLETEFSLTYGKAIRFFDEKIIK